MEALAWPYNRTSDIFNAFTDTHKVLVLTYPKFERIDDVINSAI